MLLLFCDKSPFSQYRFIFFFSKNFTSALNGNDEERNFTRLGEQENSLYFLFSRHEMLKISTFLYKLFIYFIIF
jgi:hypothetical protein